MSKHRAAHAAAVFVDFESLGNVPKQGGSDYFFELQTLFNRLPAFLKPHGLLPIECWGVARVGIERYANERRSFEVRISPDRQTDLTRELAKCRVSISWCRDVIADYALIHEVERRLSEGSLPRGVVFVTNDSDFIPLATRLAKVGHRIAVVGYQYSEKWYKVTDVTLSVQDILGLKRVAAR